MQKSSRSIFFTFVLPTILLIGCSLVSTPVSTTFTPESLEVEEQADDTKPKTVNISSDGSGDFATIEEAIEAVPPDSTMVLGEGRFELSESLLIEKSLSIQGTGSNLTTISKSTSGSPIILFKGEQLTITGVAIERTGEFASNIMVIDEGEAYLEDCNISGGATSQDESIKGAGLWITGNSNVTIKNCTIENNMAAGVVVNDNAEVTIDKITSSSNEAGIVFVENSVGNIQSSTFSDNQTFGILVTGFAHVNIVGNNIINNGAIGIQFQMEASNGEVRNNNLEDNDSRRAGTDIMIWEAYTPVLIGNTCDGRGKSVLGGDHNGIVFIGRKSIPTNPTLDGNSCMVAKCTTPNGSLLSLECK